MGRKKGKSKETEMRKWKLGRERRMEEESEERKMKETNLGK